MHLQLKNDAIKRTQSLRLELQQSYFEEALNNAHTVKQKWQAIKKYWPYMTKNTKITKYQARKATTTVRLRGRLQPEQYISTKFTANKSMKSCVFEFENTDIVNNIRVTLTKNGKFIGAA